jgi:hypothetical protein
MKFINNIVIWYKNFKKENKRANIERYYKNLYMFAGSDFNSFKVIQKMKNDEFSKRGLK